ncbi:glycosyltransferase family 39 protein [Sphingomonas sp. SUN019]|uniref:glycosyltransferase family 39 protein n=1 Tax=Sphingomonas sp. SUN019 TaxID=2937788 RepID=UPI002164B306|nr:glycosyltransferase family 39 protein [Sphingomonas sp. SUN019]UVO50355.1 glycosyltransferase family 39 protein [Sphingomonas sp. SUN019]
MAEAGILGVRAGTGVRLSTWMIGILFVSASIVIFLLNTHRGIGVLPDTTRYMRLGPMSYDAPLYTWLLDLIRASGTSFLSGARALALVFVAANTWLLWSTLLRGAGKPAYAAAGTALIVLSPQFVGLHAVAMSEAVFLFALLVVVLSFLEYLESGRNGWLLACGLALGLAMLVRFTAAPMAIAMAAVLLFDPRRALRRRFIDIGVLAVVSGVIFLGWAIVSELTTGRSTGRAFAFNGNADFSVWWGGVEALSTFLLPGQIPAAARIAFLFGVTGVVGWLAVRHGRRVLGTVASGDSPGDQAIPVIWALFVAAYIPFMVLAISIEANLTFDGRYVLPLYIALTIVGICAAASWSSTHPNRLVLWTLAVLATLVIASHLVRTTDRTRENYVRGIGYSGVEWTSSPVVGAVAALPADAVIFSNAPDALNYLTPRKTAFIPMKTHPRTGREDPANTVRDVIERMRRSLAAGNGYIVFLDGVDWRFYTMTEAEVVRALRPALIRREPDGRIYGPASPPRAGQAPPPDNRPQGG